MTVLERMDPFLTEFDRLTQRAFGQPTRTGQWYTPMDVVRRDNSVHVTFDLPGVDPDTVDVTVENNALIVHATRSIDYGEGDQILVHERAAGEVTRKVGLGEWADADNVQATYTNGVLTLTIPMREQAKPRKIEIQQGSKKQLTN